MKTILCLFLLLLSNIVYGLNQYNTSPELINTTYKRSYYFPVNSTEQKKWNEFLSADRNIPVVIHSHGCNGIGWYEEVIKDFYHSLGYHVIWLDFLTRGDAQSSCPSVAPSSTGHLEVINPNRQQARLLELESEIKWLRDNGFNNIIVTGHSEGGKTVQQLRMKVNAVIVHGMDCKSREFYKPIDENRYLFLYSYRDPWITGNVAYRTVGCGGFFDRNITEKISDVKDHHPFADPKWKQNIVDFLNKK